jgi:hypothetical protein
MVVQRNMGTAQILPRILIMVWICVAFLLSGCGGNLPISAPHLTAEEKALLRRYGRSEERVVRWPDGNIDVYDTTGQRELVQAALDHWNAVIGGPVMFRLSDNPEAPVKINLIDSPYAARTQLYIDSSSQIYGATVEISLRHSQNPEIYVITIADVTGLNTLAISEDYGYIDFEEPAIRDLARRVLRAMYRVPPGYPLED